MKIYVKSFTSKSTNRPCFALCADLGYREVYLSFDRNLCAELLKKPVVDLYQLEHGNYEVK